MKISYIPFWMYIPLMFMPVEVSVDIGEGQGALTKCVYKKLWGHIYILKIETIT